MRKVFLFCALFAGIAIMAGCQKEQDGIVTLKAVIDEDSKAHIGMIGTDYYPFWDNTDKVRITVKVPESIPNNEVPPLMFITFVENAFKHGVSYRQDSFIDIEISINDGHLIFCCSNSRIPKEEDKHGGVGLANVKQRLDLIYKDRYKLDINDEPSHYTVKLNIPL